MAVLGNAGESDVDRYAIDVEAGQRVTFEVVGNRLGQDFDPVVTIKDAKGRRIVERDNDVGLMFDCRFAHTFETTGTYTIEIQDTRFRGSDHLVYVLRVGRFPEGRVALPSTVRPGDSVTLSLPGEQGASVRVAIPDRNGPRDLLAGAAAQRRSGLGLGSAPDLSSSDRSRARTQRERLERHGRWRPGVSCKARSRRPTIATHSPSSWPPDSG